MERDEYFLLLEKSFIATFQDELIPGILHNFANPLNGIMGRAQILHRRLEDVVKKMAERYPEASSEFAEFHRKLLYDASSIVSESDRFHKLFRDVAGKFYATDNSRQESINLSKLIASELRFADYYLDFKHEIRKEISLDEAIPPIQGHPGDYSACFWGIFRNALIKMKGDSDKQLTVSSFYHEPIITVDIRYHGSGPSENESKSITQILQDDALPAASECLSSLCLSLILFKRMGVGVTISHDEKWNNIRLTWQIKDGMNK